MSPALHDKLARWLKIRVALQGGSEHSLAAYRADLVSFLNFLDMHFGGHGGVERLGEISQRDMRAWMAFERERGLSARSLARRLSAVKGFARWVSEENGIDMTGVLAIRAPRFKPPLPRPLSEGDAVQLIGQIGVQGAEPWIEARDIAVVTLLYGCGLRISEALSLRQRDMPLGDSLRIIGKGKKMRIVPVIPVVREAVSAYLKLCPFALSAKDAIFRGTRGGVLYPAAIQKVIATIRTQMGLPASATPHAMRHSFATHLLKNGGDLRMIQDLLGHASLSSTQIYTAVDSAQIMEVYNQAHPKALSNQVKKAR